MSALIDPRRPLGPGDIVTTSFRALRARPGLLLALPLCSFLVPYVLAFCVGIAAALAIPWQRMSLLVAVPAGALVVAVMLVITFVATFKFGAMQVAAVAEIAKGGRPSFGSTWAATRGVVARMVAVILLGVAVCIGLTVLMFVVFFAGPHDGSAMVVLVLLGVAVFVFLMFASLYVAVRLVYLVQFAALDQVSGIEVIRRSWRLTDGAFWRTLGYALLGSLIAVAPSWLVQAFSTVRAAPPFQSSTGGAGIEDLIDFYGGVGVVSIVALLICQWLAVAYQPVHQTVMFLDARNRQALPAVPGMAPAWTAGGPNYPTPGTSPFPANASGGAEPYDPYTPAWQPMPPDAGQGTGAVHDPWGDSDFGTPSAGGPPADGQAPTGPSWDQPPAGPGFDPRPPTPRV